MQNKITKLGVGALMLSSVILMSGAQTAVNLNLNVDGLSKVKIKSDTAITKRLSDLNKTSVRVSQMKNVSASEVANINATLQTNINNLTSLKLKIDADTDINVAKTDAKTITGNYRIYALVIPKSNIVASVDRINTIVSLMNGVKVQLQSSITAKNATSLQSYITDMNAKLSDATAKAASANSLVINLVPDQGNATVAASNKAAIISARANLKIAESDLKAARADITAVTNGLK